MGRLLLLRIDRFHVRRNARSRMLRQIAVFAIRPLVLARIVPRAEVPLRVIRYRNSMSELGPLST